MRAAQRIIDGRGFATVSTENAKVRRRSWLSSLPGHLYANVRQAPINTLNLTHLMQILGDLGRTGTNVHFGAAPLLTPSATNETTPFRLVKDHVGDVGHTLKTSAHGRIGKSVLLWH
ncbi:MAG: hypothetical protein AcusKO_42330 [Acuticoccus sp.]